MRGCRPLTDGEIERVLGAFERPTVVRDRAIFITMLRTGLRISYVLSLRVGDISHDGEIRNRVRVRRAALKGRRSGTDMPLHAEAAAALQLQPDSLTTKQPEAVMFPGRQPRACLNRIQARKIIKIAFVNAGLYGARGELGCHTARKTYARKIYQALGYDLVRTCHAMGHSSVATTIKDISFDEADVDEAILSL